MEYVTLGKTGLKVSRMGLGGIPIQRIDAEGTKALLHKLADQGVNYIDTARGYTVSEEYLGYALEGIRDKFVLATKSMARTKEAMAADIEKSLHNLRMDYIDLYLIHWPVPGCYLNTWKEMEKFLESGRVLSIGVSNFEIRHLEELRKVSGIVPAVNQIECHPLCYPRELIEYCQANGIQVQAYAPLARGAYLDNDILCVLGTKYAHTPAQIGLRWAVQKGISVIPKSTRPERIAANARIFDFEIEQEDMDLLDTLNQNYHSSHVPEDLRDTIF